MTILLLNEKKEKRKAHDLQRMRNYLHDEYTRPFIFNFYFSDYSQHAEQLTPAINNVCANIHLT